MQLERDVKAFTAFLLGRIEASNSKEEIVQNK